MPLHEPVVKCFRDAPPRGRQEQPAYSSCEPAPLEQGLGPGAAGIVGDLGRRGNRSRYELVGIGWASATRFHDSTTLRAPPCVSPASPCPRSLYLLHLRNAANKYRLGVTIAPVTRASEPQVPIYLCCGSSQLSTPGCFQGYIPAALTTTLEGLVGARVLAWARALSCPAGSLGGSSTHRQRAAISTRGRVASILGFIHRSSPCLTQTQKLATQWTISPAARLRNSSKIYILFSLLCPTNLSVASSLTTAVPRQTSPCSRSPASRRPSPDETCRVYCPRCRHHHCACGCAPPTAWSGALVGRSVVAAPAPPPCLKWPLSRGRSWVFWVSHLGGADGWLAFLFSISSWRTAATLDGGCAAVRNNRSAHCS